MSLTEFAEQWREIGRKEGEAAGLARGLEFARWHKKPHAKIFSNIYAAFEYWEQNIEGKFLNDAKTQNML